jgi:hypothetical protein
MDSISLRFRSTGQYHNPRRAEDRSVHLHGLDFLDGVPGRGVVDFGVMTPKIDTPSRVACGGGARPWLYLASGEPPYTSLKIGSKFNFFNILEDEQKRLVNWS